MIQSQGRFCQLYRLIGALLLLLAILFLLLRSCNAQKPGTGIPTVEATYTVLPPETPTMALLTTTPRATLPTRAPTMALPTETAPVRLPTATPGAMLPTETPTIALPTAAPTVALPTETPAFMLPTETPAFMLPTETPTIALPTALPIALPTLNPPSMADFTPDGVKLSGTGQPGATVEVWDGATKIGTAVVGVDGIWSLVARLSEGTHKLTARTVDAAGNVLNESSAIDIIVPKAERPATPEDLTASGEAYIVQWGDWLMKLARRFYGDPSLYILIVDGTNAKARVDPTFARITNPNLIWFGQKLWIPAKPTKR